MTLQDFSIQFDIFFNNIASNQAPGLNEYEKSVFLTKAQENLVLSLYTGKNSFGESLEQTEEMRRYLANLLSEASLTPLDEEIETGFFLGMGNDSSLFRLPNDLWFITYEAVKILNEDKCNDKTAIAVVPVTQDKFQRTKNNPFRGVNDRRALRLELDNNLVEIFCKYPVSHYYIKYLKKLQPIILEDLTDDLSINGCTKRTECVLHESLHQRILDEAVRLALLSWGLVKEPNRE